MGQVAEVKQRGEWFTVKGVDSTGHATSADVHASYLEGKSDTQIREGFKRAVETIGRYERSERGEGSKHG